MRECWSPGHKQVDCSQLCSHATGDRVLAGRLKVWLLLAMHAVFNTLQCQSFWQRLMHSFKSSSDFWANICVALQFIAKTKDAVSATCCYTQRQLSWQLAEAGQKNKIELQWDDITSLRVTPMVGTDSL